jgi:DEAD/DEAH box helicase domain-containing protein
MNVTAFLESLQTDPAYRGQIVHMHEMPKQEAVYTPLPEGLSRTACAYLKALGISRLYSHQAEAIDATLAGKDTLVTTSAASGKSLCYQVPLVQRLTDDPTATALLLFPTKALARDQVATWNRGVHALPSARRQSLRAVAFDADTGTGSRQRARDAARVLVTNPEMLHATLLPAHPRWARFLQGLRLVVLDEMHVYTGFFGANMANLFRRLYRVCRRYTDITPRLIALSATVGNPREAAELITGRELHHVWRDKSPTGARTFVFWNPPRRKRRRWRGRRSANVEAHELMVRLVRSRIATICFSKARNSAEMIYRYTRESLLREAPGNPPDRAADRWRRRRLWRYGTHCWQKIRERPSAAHPCRPCRHGAPVPPHATAARCCAAALAAQRGAGNRGRPIAQAP